MRGRDRIQPILEKIERLWLRDEDLRLGQLLVNVTSAGSVSSLFFLEDEELDKRLTRQLEL